jgi:hypothetical protein
MKFLGCKTHLDRVILSRFEKQLPDSSQGELHATDHRVHHDYFHNAGGIFPGFLAHVLPGIAPRSDRTRTVEYDLEPSTNPHARSGKGVIQGFQQEAQTLIPVSRLLFSPKAAGMCRPIRQTLRPIHLYPKPRPSVHACNQLIFTRFKTDAIR